MNDLFSNVAQMVPATAIIDMNGVPVRLRYTEPATGKIGGKLMCADVWLLPLGSVVYLPVFDGIFKIIGKEGTIEGD